MNSNIRKEQIEKYSLQPLSEEEKIEKEKLLEICIYEEIKIIATGTKKEVIELFGISLGKNKFIKNKDQRIRYVIQNFREVTLNILDRYKPENQEPGTEWDHYWEKTDEHRSQLLFISMLPPKDITLLMCLCNPDEIDKLLMNEEQAIATIFDICKKGVPLWLEENQFALK